MSNGKGEMFAGGGGEKGKRRKEGTGDGERGEAGGYGSVWGGERRAQGEDKLNFKYWRYIKMQNDV